MSHRIADTAKGARHTRSTGWSPPARATGQNVGGYASSSLGITPATLTVTANAQNKVYDQSDLTVTYTAMGFQFCLLTAALT